MNTITIRDLLAEQAVLHDLPAADLDLIAGCARNQYFTPGAFLAREDTDANQFFVIREGKVALEMHSPTGSLLMETLGRGELVGWSWLFEPYRWVFDVEVVAPTRAIVIDSACLRDKCDADAEFGYRLMKRFARVIADRLQTTRVRLLDLYGGGNAR
ncbi:MAG TPA: cyclic nucleotide-binding domain-containing protein [Ilumatobacteraceae bacterium]|jgi:CRP-like cAMP-binding protein